ncbi:MAG: hypothetical protein IJ740_19225 [Ruminococcus sp.]|nr:hypothetical protein [Ruminococcus sp.]
MSEYYNVTPTVSGMLDSMMIRLEPEFLDAPLRAAYFYDKYKEDFEHITDFCAEHKIKVAPLKNTFLSQYGGFRRLYYDDNTYLVEPRGAELFEQLCDVPNYESKMMEYKVIPSETTEHCTTVYTFANVKCRFYTELFADEPQFRDYFKDSFSRMTNGRENGMPGKTDRPAFEYIYHMNHSDMYIYLTVCDYIAYRDDMARLTSLVELYLVIFKEIIKRQVSRIDLEYVSGELEKLGIADFEKTRRGLVLKLLDVNSSEPLNEKEQQMLDRYLCPKDFDLEKVVRLERRCDPQTVYGSVFDFEEPEYPE